MTRTVLSIEGEDAIHFLQGIVTQDVARLAEDTIQFSALLSPQGKILHDFFLVQDGARILLDTPTLYKDTLLKRLMLYKLRAKVTIATTDITVAYATHGGLADPRHPDLPRRVYAAGAAGDISEADHRIRALASGIPDSTRDFAPDEVVLLDAGYDLLHAVSFTKGCYVGQEIVARMHYKQIARKGVFLLKRDGVATRMAVLRFDQAESPVVLDGVTYQAELPAWMQPRFEQFLAEKNA